MDRRAVKTAVLLLAAVCILAACGEKEEEENHAKPVDDFFKGKVPPLPEV